MDIKAGFGIKDSKGRELGAHATTRLDDGQVRVVVHATRDGEDFGAFPGAAYVATFEAARVLVEMRIEAMRKRVTKAAEKTGGVFLTAGERKTRAAK